MTRSTRRSTTPGCAYSTRSPAARSTCRPVASCPASTPATTSSAQSTRRRPNEVVNLALGLEIVLNKAQAGRTESGGHQLLPVFPGPRLSAVGCADDQLRSRVEVRQSAPLLRLPGALDRSRHAVGGVRAERRRAVGERAPHDRRLFSSTNGRAGALLGRQAGEGILRALRPLDDDPERSGQRKIGMFDRRRADSAGRVRHFPHRPVDGRPEVERRA